MNVASTLDLETRTLLCDGFRRFAEERLGCASAVADSAAALADWKKMAANGWLRLGLPDSVGGYGSGVAALGLLLRAAGESLWRPPLLQCLGEACGALLAAPPGPARDTLLEAIAAGDAIAGLAAADVDAEAAAVAARVGSAYRLTGCKSFLLAGATWTHYLVTAACADKGDVSLYLVAGSGVGCNVRHFTAVDGRSAIDVAFDGVDAERIGPGSPVLSAARRRGQLLAAAEQTGIACAALERTTRYLAARRQFGQPILAFQAIQHRLVEAHIQVRELTSLLETVQDAYDRERHDLERLLWLLRAQASATSTRVTQLGIQLHGGMGMTAEMPFGAYYKRAMLIDNLFGSCDVALEYLSQPRHLALEPEKANAN